MKGISFLLFSRSACPPFAPTDLEICALKPAPRRLCGERQQRRDDGDDRKLAEMFESRKATIAYSLKA